MRKPTTSVTSQDTAALVGFDVTIERINGIKVGIEHINGSEWGEGVEWLIAIDLFVVRVGIIKYSEEE